MTSILRRAGSAVLEFLDRMADPATDADDVQIYSKVGQVYVKGTIGLADKLTGPFAQLPYRYVRGLTMRRTSASKVEIEPGRARDSTDVYSMTTILAKECDLSLSGPGGLDTGVEAANTAYYVYIIGDSTGANPTETLFSVQAFGPTIPAGYDHFRRIGAVRNGAASDILQFKQCGNDRTRRIFYLEDPAVLQILADGNSTADVALTSGLIPVTAFNALIQIGMFAPAVGGAASNVMTIGTANRLLQTIGQTSSTKWKWQCDWVLTATQTVSYRVSDADDRADVFLLGYDDEI